jgi:hypothetical protein
LSSPNVVVRSQVAPSFSKTWPWSDSRLRAACQLALVVQVLLVEVDVEADPEVGEDWRISANISAMPSRRNVASAVSSSLSRTVGSAATTAAAISPM